MMYEQALTDYVLHPVGNYRRKSFLFNTMNVKAGYEEDLVEQIHCEKKSVIQLCPLKASRSRDPAHPADARRRSIPLQNHANRGSRWSAFHFLRSTFKLSALSFKLSAFSDEHRALPSNTELGLQG